MSLAFQLCSFWVCSGSHVTLCYVRVVWKQEDIFICPNTGGKHLNLNSGVFSDFFHSYLKSKLIELEWLVDVEEKGSRCLTVMDCSPAAFPSLGADSGRWCPGCESGRAAGRLEWTQPATESSRTTELPVTDSNLCRRTRSPHPGKVEQVGTPHSCMVVSYCSSQHRTRS